MFKNKFYIFYAFIIMLGLFFNNASATDTTNNKTMQDTPSYYPAEIDYFGIFQKFLSDKEIQINATRYQLSSGIKIYTLTSQFGTRSDLKENTAVGFEISQDNEGNSLITNIYIFPKNSIPLP